MINKLSIVAILIHCSYVYVTHTWWDVVPIWTKELIFSCFNKLKQFCLVSIRTSKWWETTQQNICNDSYSPHVHLQAIACKQNQFKLITSTASLRLRISINCFVIGYLYICAVNNIMHVWKDILYVLCKHYNIYQFLRGFLGLHRLAFHRLWRLAPSLPLLTQSLPASGRWNHPCFCEPT